ncbi:hypothetical protein D6C76_07699 [Aureobasidium pullulans]|nr:hypothetical protein D6C76_07699 [Aureobasidium pullulans]
MRVLPPNWEGIHPAYPSRPSPFNESALTKAPFWAGGAGAVAAAIMLVTKRSPSAGLKTAAWTTLLFGIPTTALERYAGHTIAKPYLESKGCEVPKQKIIDRPFAIDADNYILVGGLLGIGAAASVRKPWGVTGWQRWLGAFSCGSFVGASFNQVYHYSTTPTLMETIARQQSQRMMWREDVKRFVESRAFTESRLSPDNPKQPGMTSMNDMLKNVGGSNNAMVRAMHAAAEEAAQAAQEEDVDEKDPQPHFSEMREGERVFFPEPNYKWQPGTDGVEQIESHIQKLKERRSRLANEASMLFYTLASKQNDLYLTDKDDFEREQRRVDAELMGHLHTQTYLEISRLDWCIADSQKTRLQLKALENGQQWLPQKPEIEPIPQHARRLLDDFDHENEVARAEMDMLSEQAVAALQDPGLGAIDMTTGKVVDDPHAQIKKDLQELKRVQKESVLIREAITKLREEMGIEKADD